MASIRPYPYKKGYWRAQVRRLGVIDSQVFPSKSEASAWAALREAEITGGERGAIPNLTVSDLFTRYLKEVSPGKKGERWERIRLEALGRDRIAQVRLRALDSPHVSDWQQRRLQAISGASVRRERNLLNNVFEIARKEWKWLKRNPFDGVRRPKDGRARDRIASEEEVGLLLSRASSNLSRVITFALETGMRAGEIGSMTADSVSGRIAKLVDTKNGTSRDVPLSPKALECLQVDGDRLFMTAGSISALFAKLCKECGIEGLTFHDLRRTAIVRLAKKLTPFELAKMVGHKDLRMTLNVYYKQDAEAVADKLV